MARYGYAWVALVGTDEEPIAPLPEVPEFDDPAFGTILQFYETWARSPVRALENSFDNSHFSFVHRATFGVAAQPRPSRYQLVEQDSGCYAKTVIDAANPPAYHWVSGSSEPVTQRHMRNAYDLPFSPRLDIENPSGVRHIIINCFTPIFSPSLTPLFTPIDDGHIQLCQWLFRNDSEADCPEALLVEFDTAITREDKGILESTDFDALVDIRRRRVEYSMDSDRPGMPMRKQSMELLVRHGDAEVHR